MWLRCGSPVRGSRVTISSH